MSGHMLWVILSSLTFTIMSSSFVFFLLGLFPLSFILAFSGLEIAVSIIQAQVFVILTSSYIKDSLFLHSDSSAKPGLSSKVNLNRKVSLPYLEWGRRLYSSAQNSQHFVSGIRSYSTEVNSQSFKLTPFWVTGFCDACLRSRWNKSYLHKSSHSTMSLVVWGTNLTSSVGSGRFSKQVSNMVKLPPHEYSIVIGLLLSDGWLIMPNPHSKNARLGFAQSGAHSAYFWSVFCSLAHYCSSFPTVRNRTRFDKKTIELQFFTRSLPCFTELHSLFYVNKVKIIPHNMYELLTPVVLAHWIQGDGSTERHGLILCTDSYTTQDVVRLMNVLIIRYRLDCTLRFHRPTQLRIYIREGSMPLLRTIVIPYMHTSMLYKLHSLFYPKGVKIIPKNIYELLTPVSLAHLIMGHGSVQLMA